MKAIMNARYWFNDGDDDDDDDDDDDGGFVSTEKQVPGCKKQCCSLRIIIIAW